MSKVAVVLKHEALYGKGFEAKSVVGVFSNRKEALAYCDNVDPKEETHDIVDFDIDGLLNNPKRQNLWLRD